MPCYSPLSAYRQPRGEAGGKSTIVFGREHVQNWDVAVPVELPCGQCIGCRLERSRRWAVRLMHEAQLHEASSFLTLTYSDQNVPVDGSLRVEDFQLFMKRLRRGSSSPLRFFHCGEYGERNGRPHYHVCLFGDDFARDRELVRTTKRGDSLYWSPTLTRAWRLGYAWIGDLTFESAAYVARYCLKKAAVTQGVEGLEARKGAYKKWLDGRSPEYVTMSRRPGIGAKWFEKFGREVYPSDSVVMRGQEMLPPPYYDKLLEKVDPLLFENVKKIRSASRTTSREMSYEEWNESLGRRLEVKRQVKVQTVNVMLGREFDG